MRSTTALSGLVASAAAHYMHDPRMLMKKQDTTPAVGTCGPDNGNAVCPTGECCSEYGYCGTTAEYCAAPGCQGDYSGTACDAAITPPSDSTVNLPRPMLGSIPYGTIITDCTLPGKMALTFDDGPYIYTAELLDILAANGVKATFFINANNGGKTPIYEDAAYPGLLQKMHNDGHQIASHSWSHADLDLATPQELEDEIIKNEMAFNMILGFIPTYFRPPYGNCASACQSDLDKFGYHIITWDLDTLDWEVGAEGGAANFDAGLTPSNPLTDSFICLAHDIHQPTVESLALHMILGAKDAGYELVTVGECLGDDKANWYRNPTDGGSWNSNPTTTSTSTGTTTSTSTDTATSTSTGSDTTTSTASDTATSTASDTATSTASDTATGTTSDAATSTATGTTTEKPTGEHTGTGGSTGKPTGKPTSSPTGGSHTITDKPKPTGGNAGESEDCDCDDDEPEYTPPPTVVTTVCSNEKTTVTLTYTSTYCPRPTAPPGAGHFGAPDSEGIYTPGWQSPNRTTTVWDGTITYPTGGSHHGGSYNGGYSGANPTGGVSGGDNSSPTFVPVSGGVKVAGSLFLGLAAAVFAF